MKLIELGSVETTDDRSFGKPRGKGTSVLLVPLIATG